MNEYVPPRDHVVTIRHAKGGVPGPDDKVEVFQMTSDEYDHWLSARNADLDACAAQRPKMLSAPVGDVTVRIVEGLRCPCGRQVQPYDMQYDPDGVVNVILICAQCHHDVIVIEE